MPSITGQVEVNLTVSDPRRSAAWYSTLLGLRTRYEFDGPDGSLTYVSLEEPRSGLILCLVGHASNDGAPFSESRNGLDHLEFLVPEREELAQWANRLDQLGIPHSGITQPSYTPNAMLTFRDPDNIQLEFFWRGA
jgi:catechol 2,3-dioxygenase-like lactoylglutathione lyase family enzyme